MRILSKPLKRKKPLNVSEIAEIVVEENVNRNFEDENHSLIFVELPKDIKGFSTIGDDKKYKVFINVADINGEADIDRAWDTYQSELEKIEKKQPIAKMAPVSKENFSFLFFTDERRF